MNKIGFPKPKMDEEDRIALIPGDLNRMAFRRRVIDKAGITWHEIPVALREDVISEYFLLNDADAAVMELIYLNS